MLKDGPIIIKKTNRLDYYVFTSFPHNYRNLFLNERFNNTSIRSRSYPEYNISNSILYIPGGERGKDDRPFYIPDDKIKSVMQAIKEFNYKVLKYIDNTIDNTTVNTTVNNLYSKRLPR